MNCAQYADSQLMASELFGHRRGSFTGAVADHRGLFEEASGGTVSLDEIGEPPLASQAILLRVPSVRERGYDWQLITEHVLRMLAEKGYQARRLSSDTAVVMRTYTWPRNVLQLKGIVDLALHLAEHDVIEARYFVTELEQRAREQQLQLVQTRSLVQDIVSDMLKGEQTFREIVHKPYIDREINQKQAREIIALALEHARGSYRRLLDVFGIPATDYLKFMDFLRRQRLKPQKQQLPYATSACVCTRVSTAGLRERVAQPRESLRADAPA